MSHKYSPYVKFKMRTRLDPTFRAFSESITAGPKRRPAIPQELESTIVSNLGASDVFAFSQTSKAAATSHKTEKAIRMTEIAIKILEGPPFNIKNPPHAETVELTGRNIDVTLFADACANGALPQLRRLFLNRNQIGDDGFEALAVASGALPQLRELFLNSNMISDKGIEVFSEVLTNYGALAQCQTLSLSNNNIGNPGIAFLANAFARGAMKNLEVLSLGNNQISDPGLVSLADAAIASNALSKLRELNLFNLNHNNSRNQIGDDGVKALIRAAGAMANLKTLTLYGNEIGDAGVIALADGAMANLTALNLGNNKMSNVGLNALADACTNGKMRLLKYLSVFPLYSEQLKAACQGRNIELD